MTAATPERVTIEEFPDVENVPEAMEELLSGLRNADAVAGFALAEAHHSAFWTRDSEETDALHDWDRLRDEATAEIAPQVAALLTEAIRKRLPWTWEPER